MYVDIQIPVQSRMLHSFASVLLPMHSLPSYLVEGLLHSLVLECIPLSQVTEHADQPVQPLQFPSTNKEQIYYKWNVNLYYMCNIVKSNIWQNYCYPTHPNTHTHTHTSTPPPPIHNIGKVIKNIGKLLYSSLRTYIHIIPDSYRTKRHSINRAVC